MKLSRKELETRLDAVTVMLKKVVERCENAEESKESIKAYICMNCFLIGCGRGDMIVKGGE